MIGVSSTVSWSRPAVTEGRSMLLCARIVATCIGCITNGSPDLRRCPRWARKATATPWLGLALGLGIGLGIGLGLGPCDPAT